ncbi:MAG: hypothetical protein NTW74_26435 [Acidobacteria bacterium]|nr:hypothetical protein [Acidobacteriota bacterium]
MKCGFFWVFVVGLCGCGLVQKPVNEIAANLDATDRTPGGAGLAQGRLLSAFFGLDNKLPLLAGWRVCSGAGGKDGMPVVFDREVDVKTVEAGDFVVVTRGGVRGSVHCVTVMPAADAGEVRTVLLVGEFGSAATDPPATVAVIGNLISKDGQVNYRGAKTQVTPLEAGPGLVFAEIVALDQVKAGDGGWGAGSGCPADTKQIVRVVWAGGVRRKDGDEVGDYERRQYRVEMEVGKAVTPFALGDLQDGDNNHLLCLDTRERAKRVTFAAGVLVDPNRDANPATAVEISH